MRWWPTPNINPTFEIPCRRSTGNPLNFAGLLELAETHVVRFPEGNDVPEYRLSAGNGALGRSTLRELFWRTQPRSDIRRVFFYGYHNDDPEQMFRSSLPLDRVLEDPYDLPPVILCLQVERGKWLTPNAAAPCGWWLPKRMDSSRSSGYNEL